MLLRFSVSNFGSLRDKQELSMIASHAIKDDPSGLIDAPELRNEKVLPAAVIYGANASGKSNFVKALAHVQKLVRDSHRIGAPGDGVPLNQFLLDPAYAEQPSEFTIDFILDGRRYVYSFAATKQEFIKESLFVWRNIRPILLFERDNGKFKFGRGLKGENRIIEKLTRKNSLYLSAGAQNNNTQLQSVAAYFANFFCDIRLLTDDQKINAYLHLMNLSGTANFNDDVIKMLLLAEFGVCGSRITTLGSEAINTSIVAGIDLIFNSANPKVDTSLLRTVTYPRKHKIELAHTVSGANPVFMDISKESSGTIELIASLPTIFEALSSGKPHIIDEFGSRLHTRAAEMILSLFNNKETNPKGAQLIVATHDTNLLNAKALRRDQVWFTEKDEGGATHLYPLTDIETRKGDNLEKGYLQGRYGAIPFAGSISDFKKTL